MKLTAGILMLSSGVCSWTLAADAPVATQPPVAQASTAQASPPNAPPGAVKAATASKSAAAGTPGEVNNDKALNVASTDALIKKMRARGYKPVNRNGILVFCRSEGELGSHFQRTRCNTLDELKDAERTGQEYANQIQQQGSPTDFKPDMPPNPHR
jgi:hypothetical protein